MGLYGSVYMLALFLGLVRGHSPLDIGEIMMVSGAAQLAMAPVAALLETRMDYRLLVAIGFGPFGLGVAAERPCHAGKAISGPVLAANPARAGGDAVHPARHPPGAGRLGGKGRRRRQRVVQPDAQSRRRHRHRPWSTRSVATLRTAAMSTALVTRLQARGRRRGPAGGPFRPPPRFAAMPWDRWMR